MTSVFYDRWIDDEERRHALFAGDLFVYSPTSATLELVKHARGMIEDAFGDRDPRTAQHEMTPEQFVDVVAPLKPAFIHHDRTKQLVTEILGDLGCDTGQVYFDVPRLRSMTSDNFLNAGVALQFHPHRDTWFSAPLAQVNWWMAVYEVTPDNCMAFHPRHFDSAVPNSSSEYNYYIWNQTGRREAAKQIRKETRKQPTALQEVDLDPQIRLVTPPGSPILFSGAQFHSTVPNSAGFTRYSIDFRTVHRRDLEEGRSAPNADSEPQGTTLRDFVRARDFERLPEDLVQRYDNVDDTTGVLVWDHSSAGA